MKRLGSKGRLPHPPSSLAHSLVGSPSCGSGSVRLPRDEPSCNGRLLDISGVAEKGLSGRDLVVRDDEVEDFRAMKAGGDSVGELVVSKSLPYEFTKLSNFLGMPMAGYEREITSLLRKLEASKGRGLKISMGKKKTCSSSCVKREIQKLYA